MSMQYCFVCDSQIDTDFDAEHFEMCLEENNTDYAELKRLENVIYQTALTRADGKIAEIEYSEPERRQLNKIRLELDLIEGTN